MDIGLPARAAKRRYNKLLLLSNTSRRGIVPLKRYKAQEYICIHEMCKFALGAATNRDRNALKGHIVETSNIRRGDIRTIRRLADKELGFGQFEGTVKPLYKHTLGTEGRSLLVRYVYL